jgi:hypothetical protein
MKHTNNNTGKVEVKDITTRLNEIYSQIENWDKVEKGVRIEDGKMINWFKFNGIKYLGPDCDWGSIDWSKMDLKETVENSLELDPQETEFERIDREQGDIIGQLRSREIQLIIEANSYKNSTAELHAKRFGKQDWEVIMEKLS